jgi:dipeptidyl aminopeptidase/acylaminoacyl peptidase
MKEDSTSDTIPSIPDSITAGILKYQNTRSANLVGWLPDGNGMMIQTAFAETNQLHVVYTPGGARHQKTFRSEEVIDAAICPDSISKLVIFSQDSGGNEKFQLYALDLTTMKSSMITDGHSNNTDVVWSNRGDRFAFHSTKRNGKDWDIYICNAGKGFTVSLLQEVEGTYSVLDWSPDDRQLLVQQYLSSTVSRLYTIDIDAKTMKRIKEDVEASLEEALWDEKGRGIFYTTDEKSDTRSLCYYRTADGKDTVLTPDLKWDIRYLSISRDRKKIVFTTNEHGYLSPYILDTRKFSYYKAEDLPKGIIGSFHFHPYKNILGCVIRNASHPGDVFAIDLDRKAIKQWTFSEYGELDSSSLTTPELVTYPTFDSVNNQPRMIPAFYYKPHGSGPFPVLVFIHGGPETQYWPQFSPQIQYLVNEMCIAVIAPNVRGSGGYGKCYLELDNGLRREDAVKDIGTLIEWIEKQPECDSRRIAVMGGSYGGYMSLASLVKYNKKLKAGIDLYGISNFITFLENTAAYRRDLRRVEYGDERDSSMRAFFEKISPVNKAAEIKAPLLIIQGANDPRVPESESRQIAAAVKKNGKPVWLLVASDEGHGFRKKSNKVYQDGVIAMFLEKFLVNGK